MSSIKLRLAVFGFCFCSFIYAPVPASACSVPMSYHPPTNFELAEQADVIVIGTVFGSVRENGSNHPASSVVLVRPTTLLKGTVLPKTVKIDGVLSGDKVDLGAGPIMIPASVPSNPVDLWRPHPEAFSGSCNRITFSKGMKLVLFLKRVGTGYQPISEPFSRTEEDITSEDALWVRAVKTYVGIANTSKSERSKAFQTAIDGIPQELGNNNRNLLAEEFERQKMGCRPVSDFRPEPMPGDQKECVKLDWMMNISNSMYHMQIDPAWDSLPAGASEAKSASPVKALASALSLALLMCVFLGFRLYRSNSNRADKT